MPKRVFNGHISLIRAERGAAREEDVGRDYGISKVNLNVLYIYFLGVQNTYRLRGKR